MKATIDFNIRSSLPVIASGLSTGTREFEPGQDGQLGTLLYTFKQKVPIPSYLFALASGDIAWASIGPRSLVATGPEELNAAKWELEKDTENFIQVAEVGGVPGFHDHAKQLSRNSCKLTRTHGQPTMSLFCLLRSHMAVGGLVFTMRSFWLTFLGMENPIFTYATPSIISGVTILSSAALPINCIHVY